MARVLVIVCLIAVAAVVVAKNLVKRNDEPEAEPCSELMPCGWAIYNKTTRQIDNYTKNRCICIDPKKCLRDQDDVSISSYVYRCRLEKQKS